jgi:hypothetical protein
MSIVSVTRSGTSSASVAGAAGSLIGGAAARRLGSERVALWAMVVSGGCSALSGLIFGAPPWLLGPLLGVWGFAVIADSAQSSAALSDAADPRYVGTALTVLTLGPISGVLAMRGFVRTRPRRAEPPVRRLGAEFSESVPPPISAALPGGQVPARDDVRFRGTPQAVNATAASDTPRPENPSASGTNADGSKLTVVAASDTEALPRRASTGHAAERLNARAVRDEEDDEEAGGGDLGHDRECDRRSIAVLYEAEEPGRL